MLCARAFVHDKAKSIFASIYSRVVLKSKLGKEIVYSSNSTAPKIITRAHKPINTYWNESPYSAGWWNCPLIFSNIGRARTDVLICKHTDTARPAVRKHPASIRIGCRSFTASAPADARGRKHTHTSILLRDVGMQQAGNVSLKSQINAPEAPVSRRITILCIFPGIRDAFKNFVWPPHSLRSFLLRPLVGEMELFCGVVFLLCLTPGAWNGVFRIRNVFANGFCVSEKEREDKWEKMECKKTKPAGSWQNHCECRCAVYL